MITIGITGIIGSGKTTASASLRKKGLPVIDLDELAKRTLVLKEVHEEITDKIGSGLVVNGKIVVEQLRDIVFTDREKLRKLEEIVHPRVRAGLWDAVMKLKGKGRGAVIVDGPLLFETGLHKELDRTVVVSADMETIRERLKKRGMSADDIEKRITHQIPLEEKEKAADFIVRNNGTREDLDKEIENLFERIKEWEVKTRCISMT